MSLVSEPATPGRAIAPHRIVELALPDRAAQAGLQVARVDFAFGLPLDAPAYASLDAAERARAARFLRPDDATRSAATRAALRERLGIVLGVPPATLRFAAGEAGRPTLMAGAVAAREPAMQDRAACGRDGLPGDPAGERADERLPDFNVSHSGAHALIAWSETVRVGVDIETISPGLDWQALGRSVFAPADRAAVHALPSAERLSAFYRVWTAKEALLKALGVGIAGGLTAFSVLDQAQPGQLVPRVVDPASPAAGVAAYVAAWLEAPAGYAACLAWRPADGA